MSGKLLAVDLFSGAGGLSLGFVQTGQIRVAAAVENNKSAQQTYLENHPGVSMYGDIRNVDYNQILNECRNMGADKVNIVFGGPPCQGFSNANRQKASLISANNQLVKEFVKAIELLNPDGFVMENVKELKSNKHKFFLSSHDEQEVAELGLVPSEEKVSLGEVNTLNSELLVFLNETLRVSIPNYVIGNKVLFSKLNHLYRKKNKAEVYLKKTRIAIKSFYSNWENLHDYYWSPQYKEKWMQLKDLLQDEKSLLEEVFSCLTEVIGIQQVIMRAGEIETNGLKASPFYSENNEIVINLQTYIVLDYLKAKFRSLGYKFNEDQLVLNSANFGAPQQRERLFLVGVKNELVKNIEVNLPEPIIKNTKQFYTVKDAIVDLENVEPLVLMEDDQPLVKANIQSPNPLLKYLQSGFRDVRNHIMTDTRETALRRFKMLQPGQNFHHLDDAYKDTYSNPQRTQNTVYLRLNYNTPSGTVLNIRKSMWIHPVRNRAVSIREAARLQTFPDSFVFMGAKDAQYQQVGNAVPPLLGRAVADQLLYYLGHFPVKSLKEVITPPQTVDI
ncbi:MAG TPA: DNA cytosine methyltransferase [Paenibacillus sp.]|uniref:DNA cytosine methyltransferase n=1 Tax=Paenibacillus TaxID=44249 RepID=UPI000BA013AC|nr:MULTISPECIES: DNA cytosine methyltransferase [Paenibacillus]OZQ60640.1 DNA cytosine methyltransferase [Paenibacillus taichungensis]HBU80983.1 DNA cytosine methyltransferase [Paenibacillus sp.]